MTSFSLDTSDNVLAHSLPLTPYPHSLRSRWSYGRGYIVIALLAPLVLGGLLLVHLHSAVKLWLCP